MDLYLYTADILKKYERFTPVATWDVNAYRLGYGSDTITLDNGTYRKVVQGDKTTIPNATKDLARRVREFEKKVIKRVGSDYWNPLDNIVKGQLISMAYNYGNITKDAIIKAIHQQDNNAIADAIIKSTYNDNPGIYQKGLRIRRKKEADAIRKAPPPHKPNSGLKTLLILLPILFFGYKYLTK
jgi:GH24 family phage-related lysozyme (muramidase)